MKMKFRHTLAAASFAALAAFLLLPPQAPACHGLMNWRFLPPAEQPAGRARFEAAMEEAAKKIKSIPRELLPAEVTDWQKYYGNPIFKSGPAGSWEDWSVDCFTIAYINNQYWMWYVGTAATCQIGLATSPDGIHWTRCPENPILKLGNAGEWDSASVLCQQVLFDEQERLFKMWYVGGSTEGRWGIGYASSADGIHWTKYAGNPVMVPTEPWENHLLEGQTVLKTEGGYKMWYGALSVVTDSCAIGLASSPDGIHWTKHPENPVLEPTQGVPGAWDGFAVDTPDIIYSNGLYYMWYRGWKRAHGNSWFGLATSPDGVRWEKSAENPVFFPASNPAAWDAWQIYRGRVLLASEVDFGATQIMDRMWYTGRAYSRKAEVGLAYRLTETEPENKVRRIFPRVDQDNMQFQTEVTASGGVRIAYFTPWLSRITLSVFDAEGRLVRTVEDRYKLPGFYEASWDGRDERSAELPAGLYFCEIKSESQLITREVLLR